MRKSLYAFLLILFGLSSLFFTSFSVAAEPSSNPDQMTAIQTQPGSKEPEGLESTPPSVIAIGWDVTLASKYLFQGVDYSDGNPVVQPEVTLTAKDFSAILWSNYNLDTNKANEFDLYLQYTWEIQDFSLTAGYAHYNYPHREGWDPSQDVSISISYEALLNPYLSIHYDFDAGEGIYSTLGISHEVESYLGPLSLGLNLFYQGNYYENSGFPSMEFTVNTGYPMGSFSITPSISYFLSWDNGDFRDNNAVADTWLFSINVAQTVYKR